MSHLSRRYTEHYYVEENGQLVKKDVLHLNSPKYIRLMQDKGMPVSPMEMPNGVFPCKHEERGFVGSGKKSNHTHARYKRKNKARIRARKAK